MDTKRIGELAKHIDIKIKKEETFQEALTHRSFINESKKSGFSHNERLEFLGDAVLELIVTEFLFEKYPELPEGILTSFRAALVKTESLATEAKKIELGKFLFMSKGEEATGGRNRPYILANAFEALIGAIYKDQGYDTTKEFILKKVCYKINDIAEARLDVDAKSKLQELAQEAAKITPNYELIAAIGPDHSKTFEMGVKIGKSLFGKGKGKSKQEAEQKAAEEALSHWEELKKKYLKSDNK